MLITIFILMGLLVPLFTVKLFDLLPKWYIEILLNFFKIMILCLVFYLFLYWLIFKRKEDLDSLKEELQKLTYNVKQLK